MRRYRVEVIELRATFVVSVQLLRAKIGVLWRRHHHSCRCWRNTLSPFLRVCTGIGALAGQAAGRGRACCA